MAKKLTKLDAIRLFERATDQENLWEHLMDDFYDEKTDSFPSIYDVMIALGVSKDEYVKATGAENVNWDAGIEKPVVIERASDARIGSRLKLDVPKDPIHPDGERTVIIAEVLGFIESEDVLIYSRPDSEQWFVDAHPMWNIKVIGFEGV
ncbi:MULTISPECIES: hypothetical protein [Vibrio]|uniref:hypothetical protein n=1 Tax=Vibrio TaxID=662 RepID=UPI001C9CF2CF|nr:hypothetical protein [Vibrio parahaemolyticus]MBY7719670.1 hypothetical protein [Vibrio parahaemolyticus]MDF5600781.1 hypothetical protein [Vibrio parahaemolyticus]